MMPRPLSASVEKLGGTTAETEQKPWCRHQSWKQFGTVVPGEQLWSTLWYHKAPSTSLSLGMLMKKGFLTETATPVSKSKQCPACAPEDVQGVIWGPVNSPERPQ